MAMKLNGVLAAAGLLGLTTSFATAEADLTDAGYDVVTEMLHSGEWEVRTNWPLPSNRDMLNRDGEVLFVPVTVHVVRSDVGTGGVDIASVDAAIADANAKYNDPEVGNFGYKFYRESVVFLDDDDFYWFHLDGGEFGSLIQQGPVPGTVNAYFVPFFISQRDIAGVSTMPYSQVGGMAIHNEGTGAFAHEVGHYLGLFHPFEWETFGDECASGDGCQFSGDLICETPADPGTGWWGNFREPTGLPAGYCYRCGTDYEHDWDPGANDGQGEMTDTDPWWADVDCDDIGPDCETPFVCGEDALVSHLYQPLTHNVMSYYDTSNQTFVSEQLSLCRANLQFFLADHIRSDTDCNGNDLPDSFEIESLWYETEDCDANGHPDDCDIADSPALDCDEDGLIDDCEIADYPEIDCDENGRLDACDLVNYQAEMDCNGNSTIDSCEIHEGDAADCDGNGYPDECDLNDPATDCDANGVIDVCEVALPEVDCDGNGRPDDCDLADGGNDCDGNGVLDFCEVGSPEVDCDGNGHPDSCDIEDNPVSDCDGNDVLDVCEVANGDVDCDGNNLPDNCDIEGDQFLDCNGNGELDACEIESGSVTDCDGNLIPDWCDLQDDPINNDCDDNGLFDACEIAQGTATDCDGSGVLDRCEMLQFPEMDCNANGVFDGCEVVDGLATDCDGNDVLDQCQMNADSDLDCNQNGTLDSCEIENGTLEDCDGSGVPDMCEESLVRAYGPLAPLSPPYQAHFAYSVSLGGAYAVFGMPGDNGNATSSGAASVYRRLDAETWTAEATLRMAGGGSYDELGTAVAMGDEFVAAGAPGDDSGGSNAGSVAVFRKGDAGWSQETVLQGTDTSSGDKFGSALSVSGNTLVAGAPLAQASDVSGQTGVVYVFASEDGAWSEVARLTAGGGSEGDFFGSATVVDGSRILIGAPHAYANGSHAGLAYAYRFDGENWSYDGTLVDSSQDQFNAFGTAVDVDGNWAAVGAPGADVAGINAAGAADIFERTAGGWTHRYRVSASDLSADSGFGSQVSIEGNLLLVSAPSHDGRTELIPNSGGLYVFTRQGDAWIESGLVASLNPDVGARFGASLAAAGALSAVGAPYVDGAVDDTGAAYISIQLDCDQSGQMDVCQIESGGGDCDGDGILDTCAVAMGFVDDCNYNAVPDSCDLIDMPELDLNGNGVIDSCEGPDGFPGGEDGFTTVDLMWVLDHWGTSNADADHDGDGVVGIRDLILVLMGWRGG